MMIYIHCSDDDTHSNIFLKLIAGNGTREHKTALVKEQCRLDMRKYSFSQRMDGWKKILMIVLLLAMCIMF